MPNLEWRFLVLNFQLHAKWLHAHWPWTLVSHCIMSIFSNFSFTFFFLVSSFWAVVFCTSQVASKLSFWWQHSPHLTTVVHWIFHCYEQRHLELFHLFFTSVCILDLTKWDDPRIIESPTKRNDRHNNDECDTIGYGCGPFFGYVDDEILMHSSGFVSVSPAASSHRRLWCSCCQFELLPVFRIPKESRRPARLQNEQQGFFGREKSQHGSSEEDASEMLSSRDPGGGAGGSCLWGLPGITWMYSPCVQQGLPQEKRFWGGLTAAHQSSKTL